jgi:hypothetical protein
VAFEAANRLNVVEPERGTQIAYIDIPLRSTLNVHRSNLR